jgi:chromosome segregation ATPase
LLLQQNEELSIKYHKVTTQIQKLSIQVQQQFSHISSLEQERKKLQEELLILEQKHQLTKDELEFLRRQIFGRKSERFIGMDPEQLTLELEGMVETMRKEKPNRSAIPARKPVRKKSRAIAACLFLPT